MKIHFKETVKDTNFKILVVVSLLTSLTLCVLAPMELYFSNKQEFWFGISEVLGFMLICFFGFFLFLLAIGVFLKGKLRMFFGCMIFGIGLALYLQANFLNGEMGVMNGQEIDWCADKIKLGVNVAVWCLCVTVPVFFCVFVKKIWTTLVCVLSAMLIVMQLSAVVSLALTAPEKQQSVCLTTDDIYTLSAKDNIIVFVLDTLDTQYFETYIKDNPKYKKMLEQYTYYDNAVAGGGPTVYGLPLLLSGQYYNGDIYNKYLEFAYGESDLYDKLKRNNWDVRLYTLDEFVVDDFFISNIDNAKSLAGSMLQSAEPGGLAKTFYKAAWYKYFPNIAKNRLFYYTEEFEQFRSIKKDNGTGVDVYNMDDEVFIHNFREKGITLTEDKNAYRFYHLFGAHGPYKLNENGDYIDAGTSLQEQLDGVWNMLDEFFEQMKTLGIYEDSTIIITGDHGAYDIYQNPCILIKEKKSKKTDLEISHAPITFQNILPTLSKAIDGVNDEKNRTVFEVKETEDNVRYQVINPALVKQFYCEGTWRYPHLFSIKGDARGQDGLTDLGQINMVFSEAPTYHLGKKLSFREGGNGLAYLCEGFGNPEETGSWTIAASALQKIEFDSQPDRNLKVNIGLWSVFHDRQHVTIWFNDSCVYSQYQTGNEISFIIPKEALVDGEQKIRYRLTTTSPSEVSGSLDVRTLSIKLNSMVIAETDKEATPVTPETLYHLGEKIVFTKENDGTRFFVHGISEVENGSAWSLGEESEVELEFSEDISNLKGEIRLASVYAAPQKVIISYKGKSEDDRVSIGNFVVELTKESKEDNILWEGVISSPEEAIVFDIPEEALIDNQLKFRIKYPNAVSPVTRGEGEDFRVLSLRFLSMTFKKAE